LFSNIENLIPGFITRWTAVCSKKTCKRFWTRAQRIHEWDYTNSWTSTCQSC